MTAPDLFTSAPESAGTARPAGSGVADALSAPLVALAQALLKLPAGAPVSPHDLAAAADIERDLLALGYWIAPSPFFADKGARQ